MKSQAYHNIGIKKCSDKCVSTNAGWLQSWWKCSR